MITVTVYTKDGNMTGFSLNGHAGFASHGKDILCAGVSALVLNTINSIEAFTDDLVSLEQDEKKGFIDYKILSGQSTETKLLLKALMLGLSNVQEEYGTKYIRFQTKEV